MLHSARSILGLPRGQNGTPLRCRLRSFLCSTTNPAHDPESTCPSIWEKPQLSRRLVGAPPRAPVAFERGGTTHRSGASTSIFRGPCFDEIEKTHIDVFNSFAATGLETDRLNRRVMAARKIFSNPSLIHDFHKNRERAVFLDSEVHNYR